jgi:hypothetical protein
MPELVKTSVRTALDLIDSEALITKSNQIPRSGSPQSSSLIPSRTKQTMQPSSPPDVSSSVRPQPGQVEISEAAGCIV